jgi:hypothetical protein
MKNYLALAALSLLAGCAEAERSDMANEGFFDIMDAPATGTADYDYKISIRTITLVSYNLHSQQGRLELTKDTLGGRCPSPTVVREQIIHVSTTAFGIPIDKVITEVKCHPVTT